MSSPLLWMILSSNQDDVFFSARRSTIMCVIEGGGMWHPAHQSWYRSTAWLTQRQTTGKFGISQLHVDTKCIYYLTLGGLWFETTAKVPEVFRWIAKWSLTITAKWTNVFQKWLYSAITGRRLEVHRSSKFLSSEGLISELSTCFCRNSSSHLAGKELVCIIIFINHCAREKMDIEWVWFHCQITRLDHTVVPS